NRERCFLFERRLYHHIDWALLIAVLALCALSVVTIYAATFDPSHGVSRRWIIQMYAIWIGLVAMLVTLTADYRTFTDKSHLIYIGILGLLIYVLLFGHESKGARRWIPLGAFNLQPSEFAKICVALVLAKFFGENRGAPTWGDLTVGGILTAIPFALIGKEPDLAGMRMRILGIMLIAGLLLAPIAWKFVLKDYQKSRISTFIDPSQDAKGAGYQQIQARIK